MSCSTWPANTLKALPFFSTLNDAELTWLLPSVRRRSFKAKISVLHAGEPADGLYILVSGKARLVHQDNEGHTLIAEVFGPGEVFGEMGLIDATPCPASVVAVNDIETAFIPRESLLECIGTSRTAAVHLLRTSLERLCKAHQQMANLALTKVYTRVAKVLAAHGNDVNGEWHVDVGAEQIAGMVGASREMVSRVVRCMINKQLVRRSKRKLIVLDRDALLAAQS